MRLLTIGHSTLALEVFVRALKENGCRLLVDVRSVPRSRWNPQFEQAALFDGLAVAGITGVWRKGLGGLRRPKKDSVNVGWRKESFRGYADYMQTAEFAREIDWLLGLGDGVVVMCAEAVPWRCHRLLIGDAVLARGGEVEDIFVDKHGVSSRRVHEMTELARVEGGTVWYPGEPGLFG